MINPLLIDNDPEHRFAVLLRMAVWILFFLVLYLLRSFSVLVFLTFVFSYIQAHGVSKIQRYFKRRTYSVIFVFTIFVGALVGMGSYMVPQVINQAEIFADNFRGYVSRLDAEIIKVKNDYPTIGNLIPEVQVQSDHVTLNESGKISDSVSASVIPYALGFGSADHSVGSNFDIKSLTELLKNIGKPLLALLSSFLLALLFSFLIVLDLPRLTSSVRDLKDTKIGFIYEEVGGSLASFGRTLGHALEAQLVIAVINTVLTAIAIFFFGIATKLAFLSLIVFFCSFIPVAGVFLSSIPICLLVLEADGGHRAFY